MADVRAGEWPQEVPLELADIMKEKATMMPIIRRLVALESKVCKPTAAEICYERLYNENEEEMKQLQEQLSSVVVDATSSSLSSNLNPSVCVVCFFEYSTQQGIVCSEEHFTCDRVFQ